MIEHGLYVAGGMVVGAVLGILITAMCSVSGDSSRASEQWAAGWAQRQLNDKQADDDVAVILKGTSGYKLPAASCRTCKHAYCRTEETKHYQYEACALGMLPMTFYLNGYCDLFDLASEEMLMERINYKPSILWGEAING